MYLYLVIYATAIVAANLFVAALGPWVSPVNGFVLIGLDLVLRDMLQARLSPGQMLALILSTGLVTLMLNPAAGQIAAASAIAFTASSLVDWGVFSRLRGTWMLRSNASNAAGAAVDSLLFPTIAFGVLMPHIVAGQFLAKAVGGAFWSWVLRRQVERLA